MRVRPATDAPVDTGADMIAIAVLERQEIAHDAPSPHCCLRELRFPGKQPITAAEPGTETRSWRQTA